MYQNLTTVRKLMKIIKPIACLLFPLAFSANSLAEDFSFGVGVGSLYSGVGVNAASRSATDLKYLSAGCVSYSDYDGSTCGVGVGWIKTDLFNSQNTKHGFGAYLGVVGSERVRFSEDEALYGLGLGYHYFFNGIERSGTNLGVSYVAGDAESGFDSAVMIQVGYQF
jgi:hypothetical protein